MNIIVKQLASLEQSQTFLDGSKRSRVALRSVAIGLGTYQPGWRWSLHAGPKTGKVSAHHIGYVISGRMMVTDAKGHSAEIAAGDAFELLPGHDAWVLGDEPCVALDFAPLDRHTA
jgi:uncharacterized cupin superfamily protein